MTWYSDFLCTSHKSLLLVYRSLFASSSKRHWQIYLVTFLKCYCAIAASCKELVNPTIRTTRSTIFDDRREDGKCHLKVETICSFFNLSWYVKSLKVATAEILTNLFKKITQFYSFKYNPHCSKKIQN